MGYKGCALDMAREAARWWMTRTGHACPEPQLELWSNLEIRSIVFLTVLPAVHFFMNRRVGDATGHTIVVDGVHQAQAMLPGIHVGVHAVGEVHLGVAVGKVHLGVRQVAQQGVHAVAMAAASCNAAAVVSELAGAVAAVVMETCTAEPDAEPTTGPSTGPAAGPNANPATAL